ncbi:uncharacterized protein DSM5745_09145 [Aspergillus mulundensis]|uniref:Uncharacterized protein n=1 Tax=Aspergillus mulundensis TaxID=1810919 RepID=A0A3D8QZR5_9EURO|nr:hypothetical protein DSM5745_09145 [Aspergillus mulundensis]RDW67279.1 hypothetical protein DSM5745_09145 [Aspergillus mulundensis]
MLYLAFLLLALWTASASASALAQGGGLPCSGTVQGCANRLQNNQAPGAASKSADCSSFQRTTVSLPATTVTSTVSTVTVTVTDCPDAPPEGRRLAARQVTVTPTATPTYLDGPCTTPGNYASACSCIGIPPTITTVPGPTETSSVTATVTVTVAPICEGATCPDYVPVTCEVGLFNICACGIDTNGDPFCFANDNCDDTPTCTSNAECAAGRKCLDVGPCCPGEEGLGHCFVEAPPGTCPPACGQGAGAQSLANPSSGECAGGILCAA